MNKDFKNILQKKYFKKVDQNFDESFWKKVEDLKQPMVTNWFSELFPVGLRYSTVFAICLLIFLNFYVPEAKQTELSYFEMQELLLEGTGVYEDMDLILAMDEYDLSLDELESLLEDLDGENG